MPVPGEWLCGPELCPGSPLARLASRLEAKREECEQLVVYGAALGQGYLRKFNRLMLEDTIPARVLRQRHGDCFFKFVTEAPRADDLDVMIRVDALPYRGNRRNVKVLKLLGHLLFPWAHRLLWIDAKIRLGVVDPLVFFDKAVAPYCAAFVGLPRHENAFGSSPERSYVAHYATVRRAAQRRDLTDSVDAIDRQVAAYLNATSDGALSGALVDSAYIGRDLRRCPAFNAALGLAWFEEIALHSDRDQLALPFVLTTRLGLTVDANLAWSRDNTPLVHFLPPDHLHWYYSHALAVGKCLACVQSKKRRPRRTATRPPAA